LIGKPTTPLIKTLEEEVHNKAMIHYRNVRRETMMLEMLENILPSHRVEGLADVKLEEE
jgi:hypothetical protein